MDITTLSPQQIAAMSQEQQIAVAKEAYAQFLEVMDSVSEQQREVLNHTLEEMRQQHITNVRNTISHM